MIFEKQVSDAKFVVSKDELPYAEVIEDFGNTDFISILTYNISQGQHQLIDELKNYPDAEICIVTNIPGRWEKYYGNAYAEKAKKTIKLYKSRLDLENSELSVYFNFSNHAKIIMTENIVYVGSANYSEESANNFEAGFISHDTEFIDYLKDEIFPWIIDSSVELKTDNEIILIRMGLSNAISAFHSLFEEIKYAFYTYSEHSTSRDVLYYRGNNEEFSTEDIGRIERYLERYRDLLEQANRLFSIQVFSERGISNLDTVIDRVEEITEMIKGLCESSLTELALFSEEEIENQYLDDNYAEAYDEDLDRFAQEAVDLAVAEHESLAEECKEDVDSLLELLDEMAGIPENVLRRFNALPLNLIRIDNTGI